MQAIIYPITPFDATVGGNIKFSWSGSQNQVNVIIKSGSDEVYSATVTTNLHEVTIPQGGESSLENGKVYSAFIRVRDSAGVWSEVQPLGSRFLCLQTPEFGIANIPSSNTIPSSAYTFSVAYSQQNGEKLSSWSISLYSVDKVEISQSGLQYNIANVEAGDGSISANESWTFSGFDDNVSYFIRAHGKTVNGINLDTGYLSITAQLKSSKIFTQLEVDNMPDQGGIYIHSNIVSSEGKVYNADGVEVDPIGEGLVVSGPYRNPLNNEWTNGGYGIDLRPDYYMVYNDGFIIDSDFSMSLIFFGMQPNDEIQTLSIKDGDEDVLVHIYYRIGKFTANVNQACFELVVDNPKNYVYFSNAIERPTDTEKVGLVIIRSGGAFYLYCAKNVDQTYEASVGGSVG